MWTAEKREISPGHLIQSLTAYTGAFRIYHDVRVTFSAVFWPKTAGNWGITVTLDEVSWEAVSALAAVLGVLIASYLGLRATKLARKAVSQSEVDYAATRVDKLLDTGARISALVGEYKAALHVFWKEDPNARQNSGAFVVEDIVRREWLIQERGVGETRAHQLTYLLMGACADFRAQVRALRLHDSPRGASSFEVLALIRSSCMLQYYTLVLDDPFISPDLQLDEIEAQYVDTICADADSLSDDIRGEVRDWFKQELGKPVTADEEKETPEIVAINFQEDFVDPKWEETYTALAEYFYAQAVSK